MSQAELLALQKEADRALKSLEDRRRNEAKAAVEAKAQEFGFTLSELLGGKSKAKATGAPKYRHPENATLTWTGKGRQPAWFKEHVAAGGKPEALAI